MCVCGDCVMEVRSGGAWVCLSCNDDDDDIAWMVATRTHTHVMIVCAGEEDKNRHALVVALKILKAATWINIHTLPVSTHT